MTRNHLRQLLRSVRIGLLRLQQQLDLSVLRTKQRCCWRRAPEKTSRTWRWARGSLSRTGREWQCWCSQKLSRRSRSYNLTKRWWSLRKVPWWQDLLLLDLSELWRPNSENFTPVKSPEFSPLLPFLWLKLPVLDWKYPANLTSEEKHKIIKNIF